MISHQRLRKPVEILASLTATIQPACFPLNFLFQSVTCVIVRVQINLYFFKFCKSISGLFARLSYPTVCPQLPADITYLMKMRKLHEA